MRTRIGLDDDLIRTAQEYTGLVEKSALVREALNALIEAGSFPQSNFVRRSRSNHGAHSQAKSHSVVIVADAGMGRWITFEEKTPNSSNNSNNLVSASSGNEPLPQSQQSQRVPAPAPSVAGSDPPTHPS